MYAPISFHLYVLIEAWSAARC